MKRLRVVPLAVLVSSGAIALAACSTNSSGAPESSATESGGTATLTSAVNYFGGTAKQNKAPANTGDFFAGPRQDPAALKWVQLTAGKAGGLDPVVVDGAGFTLYRFDKDSPKPPTSNCNGTCAMTWPPELVEPGSKVFLDGVQKSAVGVIRRTDGTMQLTIGNWPVYRFSGDSNPGDTHGEGVGGTWFGVTPQGGKALPPSGSGSPASTTSPGSGSTPKSGGKTTVTLFDSPGFADEGSQQLDGSTGCENVARPNVASSLQLFGAPIKIWTGPNCTGRSQVLTTGVSDLADIGFDNSVESVRFGVSASTSTGSGTTTTATSPQATNSAPGGGTDTVTLGNGSAILDTGTNFSEPNGSFGVAGPGCQNVAAGSMVKSLQLSGGPVKLWAGSDCSGTSKVIGGDVPDLSAIGFPNGIGSIRFGD